MIIIFIWIQKKIMRRLIIKMKIYSLKNNKKINLKKKIIAKKTQNRQMKIIKINKYKKIKIKIKIRMKWILKQQIILIILLKI